MKSSDTGGVKPMAIAGRYVRERERLLGMTDEERAWRKQWLKDQILSPNEPRHVPEIYKEQFNPIRRAYRAPLDAFGKVLEPMLGKQRAFTVRYFTGKFLMFIGGTMATIYYFKYNQHDWTRVGGWRVLQSRDAYVPGDPEYPKLSDRSQPQDYSAKGFDKVNFKL